MQNISPLGVPVNPEPIYLQALARWGGLAQMDMAIEECAELIQAIQHLRRGRVQEEVVASEIADVLIMCGQMRLLVGPEVVDANIELKLRRRVKKDWFMLIRAAGEFLAIPKAQGKRRLTIERHHRKGQHQDEANIHGGCKGIVDCLVLWGLLVDDAPAYIEHGTPQQVLLAKGEKPFTVLILEDIAA